MKSRNSRFCVLVAILVIALTQIMCKAVTEDFPEETLISGVEVDESQLESDVFNVEANITRSDCPDHIPVPEMGLVESFEFSDKSLVITHPNERIEYTKIETASGRISYCRYPDPNHYICIDFRDENSYQIHVYDYTPPVAEEEYDRVCYAADRYLASIDDPLLNDDSVNEAEDNEKIEDQSQAEESAGLEQDSLEDDLASCLPQSTDYTLEIVDLTDHSSEAGKRHCNADGMLTNTSDRDLMFSAYRVHNYGGHNYEKWMGAGYQTVKPGETVEYAEFYRCTGGNCGGGAWYYFNKISILYNTPGCLQLAFAQEEKIPESIVEIENPCDW